MDTDGEQKVFKEAVVERAEGVYGLNRLSDNNERTWKESITYSRRPR